MHEVEGLDVSSIFVFGRHELAHEAEDTLFM